MTLYGIAIIIPKYFERMETTSFAFESFARKLYQYRYEYLVTPASLTTSDREFVLMSRVYQIFQFHFLKIIYWMYYQFFYHE